MNTSQHIREYKKNFQQQKALANLERAAEEKRLDKLKAILQAKLRSSATNQAA